MVWRFLLSIAVSLLCFGSFAEAADLPSIGIKVVPHRVKVAAKPKKPVVAKPAPAASKLSRVKPALPPGDNQAVASRATRAEPTPNEIDMSWVLAPLVANVDGAKQEGSASVEGNLIVLEPGYVSVPNMVIELTGHIVKTTRTTARIDVLIGGTQRSVTWKADDVKSGKFKIELNAPIAEGKLPAYFPVSALAFVTKDGRSGAAMVSLEKIVVRVGQARLANSQ